MRRLGRLVVGLAVLLANSSASALPIEWTVGEGGNGHFYEAVDLGTAISWQDAQAAAEAAGGHLATITSAEEDAWVRANLLPLTTGSGGLNRHGPWIGGHQDMSSPSYSEPSGGWAWTTGESWSYTAWRSGEPNNSGGAEHYLHYFMQGAVTVGWNDNAFFNPADPIDSYIIERVPEPTTGLLLGLGLLGVAVRRRV